MVCEDKPVGPPPAGCDRGGRRGKKKGHSIGSSPVYQTKETCVYEDCGLNKFQTDSATVLKVLPSNI
uniref:Uncharacterized protein n=1 Tax=Knipowitschia caucasica TaxID=637954 RepID=A0AAV2M4T4_KNICA